MVSGKPSTINLPTIDRFMGLAGAGLRFLNGQA
jgi:hypothetical protein